MSNYVLTPSAVRKLRGALAATPGNSGAAGAPSPVNIDNYPPPFTVRWSASANNKQGAWVIWLPDVASLVAFDGVYVNIGGVTAEQALPGGWYTIDDTTSRSSEVWLVVTITRSGSGAIVSVDAEISTLGRPPSATVYNVFVAEMGTDAQTGAKRVKQYVDSAVVLSGEGGGGGGGLTGTVEFVADVDWYVNGSVHQLRKRLRVLDLSTGNVTDKAGTTYANGWEVAANTTPISSILPS